MFGKAAGERRPFAVSGGQRIGDDDAERAQIAVVVANGDVVAEIEGVLRELEAGFVVLVARDVVMEEPAGAAVDEVADVVVLRAPEAADPAPVAAAFQPAASRWPFTSSGATNS